MITWNDRQNAHQKIDHIFQELLPANGMGQRPEQIRLCHEMLDAMLNGRIALYDAGTGIGKTFSYLVAGTVFHRCRAASGEGFAPILVSTSSIALQDAVRNEYLPFLSAVLLADGMLEQPLQAVVRKGKTHYVCDERLDKRLEKVNLQKKNKKAANALLMLRTKLDTDEADHLSGYDQAQVCVPPRCQCRREGCRYLRFLDACDTERYLFHICNHNLLLADGIHRGGGLNAILPDACAVVIDEAHKLPDAARQMFGRTLTGDDFAALAAGLRAERFILAAENLLSAAKPFLAMLSDDRAEETNCFDPEFHRLLLPPLKVMRTIRSLLGRRLTPATRSLLDHTLATVSLFTEDNPNIICYTDLDPQGRAVLCATAADLAERLGATLWNQPVPLLLTSGTLAIGRDFSRFCGESGLCGNDRITESVFFSPFDYLRNCLLYLPPSAPRREDICYYDALTEEIAALLDAAHGHALVLFTSYAALSAVRERLRNQNLPYPVFALGRNAAHTVEAFKASGNGVLLATGAAWEGFDFPGDCVSLLIIPRLPFAFPDARKEYERQQYPNLRTFIHSVAIPEMQIKLKQGFGRAIRTETDTCVAAILDERALRGGRYHGSVLAALPEMAATDGLYDVEQFLRAVKPEGYFEEDAE